MRSAILVLLVASSFAGDPVGCRRASSDASATLRSSDASATLRSGDASATLRSVDVDAGRPRMAPLEAPWMERLDLPGGGIAFVAPPVGSTEPRPVVVAVHGAMDDPGLICSAWRLITDVYPFVVCPGGTPVGKSYVWPSRETLDKRIDAALETVHATFGDRVQQRPAIYAAFSQGANLAGYVLGRANHGRFVAAVLTEGGYRAFDAKATATAFTQAGGRRVLFTCSQAGCAARFERSRDALTRAGAEVRVDYAGPYGHSMPPPVRASIHAALPWLVEGLAGWEGYASAPKLKTH